MECRRVNCDPKALESARNVLKALESLQSLGGDSSFLATGLRTEFLTAHGDLGPLAIEALRKSDWKARIATQLAEIRQKLGRSFTDASLALLYDLDKTYKAIADLPMIRNVLDGLLAARSAPQLELMAHGRMLWTTLDLLSATDQDPAKLSERIQNVMTNTPDAVYAYLAKRRRDNPNAYLSNSVLNAKITSFFRAYEQAVQQGIGANDLVSRAGAVTKGWASLAFDATEISKQLPTVATVQAVANAQSDLFKALTPFSPARVRAVEAVMARVAGGIETATQLLDLDSRIQRFADADRLLRVQREATGAPYDERSAQEQAQSLRQQRERLVAHLRANGFVGEGDLIPAGVDSLLQSMRRQTETLAKSRHDLETSMRSIQDRIGGGFSFAAIERRAGQALMLELLKASHETQAAMAAEKGPQSAEATSFRAWRDRVVPLLERSLGIAASGSAEARATAVFERLAKDTEFLTKELGGRLESFLREKYPYLYNVMGNPNQSAVETVLRNGEYADKGLAPIVALVLAYRAKTSAEAGLRAYTAADISEAGRIDQATIQTARTLEQGMERGVLPRLFTSTAVRDAWGPDVAPLVQRIRDDVKSLRRAAGSAFSRGIDPATDQEIDAASRNVDGVLAVFQGDRPEEEVSVFRTPAGFSRRTWTVVEDGKRQHWDSESKRFVYIDPQTRARFVRDGNGKLVPVKEPVLVRRAFGEFISRRPEARDAMFNQHGVPKYDLYWDDTNKRYVFEDRTPIYSGGFDYDRHRYREPDYRLPIRMRYVMNDKGALIPLQNQDALPGTIAFAEYQGDKVLQTGTINCGGACGSDSLIYRNPNFITRTVYLEGTGTTGPRTITTDFASRTATVLDARGNMDRYQVDVRYGESPRLAENRFWEHYERNSLTGELELKFRYYTRDAEIVQPAHTERTQRRLGTLHQGIIQVPELRARYKELVLERNDGFGMTNVYSLGRRDGDDWRSARPDAPPSAAPILRRVELPAVSAATRPLIDALIKLNARRANAGTPLGADGKDIADLTERFLQRAVDATVTLAGTIPGGEDESGRALTIEFSIPERVMTAYDTARGNGQVLLAGHHGPIMAERSWLQALTFRDNEVGVGLHVEDLALGGKFEGVWIRHGQDSRETVFLQRTLIGTETQRDGRASVWELRPPTGVNLPPIRVPVEAIAKPELHSPSEVYARGFRLWNPFDVLEMVGDYAATLTESGLRTFAGMSTERAHAIGQYVAAGVDLATAIIPGAAIGTGLKVAMQLARTPGWLNTLKATQWGIMGYFVAQTGIGAAHMPSLYEQWSNGSADAGRAFINAAAGPALMGYGLLRPRDTAPPMAMRPGGGTPYTWERVRAIAEGLASNEPKAVDNFYKALKDEGFDMSNGVPTGILEALVERLENRATPVSKEGRINLFRVLEASPRLPAALAERMRATMTTFEQDRWLPVLLPEQTVVSGAEIAGRVQPSAEAALQSRLGAVSENRRLLGELKDGSGLKAIMDAHVAAGNFEAALNALRGFGRVAHNEDVVGHFLQVIEAQRKAKFDTAESITQLKEFIDGLPEHANGIRSRTKAYAGLVEMDPGSYLDLFRQYATRLNESKYIEQLAFLEAKTGHIDNAKALLPKFDSILGRLRLLEELAVQQHKSGMHPQGALADMENQLVYSARLEGLIHVARAARRMGQDPRPWLRKAESHTRDHYREDWLKLVRGYIELGFRDEVLPKLSVNGRDYVSEPSMIAWLEVATREGLEGRNPQPFLEKALAIANELVSRETPERGDVPQRGLSDQYVNVASTLVNLGRFEQARRAIAKIKTQDKRDRALSELSLALAKAGRLEEARKTSSEIIDQGQGAESAAVLAAWGMARELSTARTLVLGREDQGRIFAAAVAERNEPLLKALGTALPLERMAELLKTITDRNFRNKITAWLDVGLSLVPDVPKREVEAMVRRAGNVMRAAMEQASKAAGTVRDEAATLLNSAVETLLNVGSQGAKSIIYQTAHQLGVNVPHPLLQPLGEALLRANQPKGNEWVMKAIGHGLVGNETAWRWITKLSENGFLDPKYVAYLEEGARNLPENSAAAQALVGQNVTLTRLIVKELGVVPDEGLARLIRDGMKGDPELQRQRIDPRTNPQAVIARIRELKSQFDLIRDRDTLVAELAKNPWKAAAYLLLYGGRTSFEAVKPYDSAMLGRYLEIANRTNYNPAVEAQFKAGLVRNGFSEGEAAVITQRLHQGSFPLEGERAWTVRINEPERPNAETVTLRYLDKREDFLESMRPADGHRCCFNTTADGFGGIIEQNRQYVMQHWKDPLSMILQIESTPSGSDKRQVIGFMIVNFAINDQGKLVAFAPTGIYHKDKTVFSEKALMDAFIKHVAAPLKLAEFYTAGSREGGYSVRSRGLYPNFSAEPRKVTRLMAISQPDGNPITYNYGDTSVQPNVPNLSTDSSIWHTRIGP
ncbi:MAG: hypothetical protein HY078_15315 [Elusimicrobia bacterium]|nr:hypothetical protein [Elusimicrobiota bacterium]